MSDIGKPLLSSDNLESSFLNKTKGKIRLNILTLNIKGLPWYYDSSSRERSKKIARLVNTKDCDVVCLQEVFDSGVRKNLLQELSKNYKFIIPEATYHYPNFLNFTNYLGPSGLFIASKYEITWQQFIPYLETRGADALSWKGILGCQIKLNLNTRIMIFVTHMNANSHTLITKRKLNNTFIRNQQSIQIIDFIQTTTFDFKLNFILCGDFNFVSASDTYRIFPPLQFKDVYRITHPDSSKEPGYTIDSEINQNMVHNKNRSRIDYTFANTNDGNLEIVDSELFYPGIITMHLESDHFGISSDYVVKEKSGNKKPETYPKFKPGYWKRFFCCFGSIFF